MSAPDAPLTPSDVIRLYGAFNRQLTRIVRAATAGPRAVIEDACQVAWTALICPGRPVDHRSARAWLVRTAVREATRQIHLQTRETPLDEAPDHLRHESDEGLAEVVWGRERVHHVSLLSERQQRLVWLRALGFSHGEIARYEATTTRTIRRQLERAHRQLRALDDGGQIDRAAA